MKAVFFNILMFSLIFGSHAQEDSRKIENDPAAQSLLEKVSNKYNASKSMKVRFYLDVDSPEEDFNAKSNGEVILKDDKYKIDTEEMTIICDNVKRYVYLKEPNELQINYHEPEEDEIESPSELFDIYKEDYYYRIVADVKIDNQQAKKVELLPTEINDSPYKRIYLYIDPEANTIVKAEIQAKDGVKYTYGIKELQEDININDSIFSFDPSKHPGIYIDDMTK